MDKYQAVNQFWNSFGIPAYDESSVPDRTDPSVFPHISYNMYADSLGNPIILNASLWYRSTSWKEVSLKSEDIAKEITREGFVILKIDNGYLWITKGTPFAQRLYDPEDDLIRRVYLTLNVEYLTSY